jgi:hypothetical protein
MPATISVGLNRKVGEANYGSRGGSVTVEMEIDAATLSDPAAFRARVQTLYAMARSSLAEELARGDDNPASPDAVQPQPSQPSTVPSDRFETRPQAHTPPVAPNSADNARGAATAARSTSERLATQSQVRAIYAIGKRQQIEPRDVVRERFGRKSPDELTVRQASQLIDELNSVGAGT